MSNPTEQEFYYLSNEKNKGAYMKYNYNFNENDYKTPPEIYEQALKYFHVEKFDCDVCCSEKNIPADVHYINGETDGLTAEWHDVNWCNPPFNECQKWVKKACKELQKGHLSAMLLPARTETAYWHEYILCNPYIDVRFLRKGYKFLNKDNEEMGVFKNALALVYFQPIPF